MAGFSVITTTGCTDPRRLAYDPVVAMWLAHLQDNPIPPSQEALLIRRWLTWEAGDETLRRKLGSHADMIRTVRGVGYRLSR